MARTGRSFSFTRAITRTPGTSVVSGLRAGDGDDPDPILFEREHQAYVTALSDAGVDVAVLPPLDAFPDSVFVEDAALCTGSTAVLLRPGTTSRRGEVDALRPALAKAFERLIDLPGRGSVDGGDVLLGDDEAFIGRSARTDPAGLDALSIVLSNLGYRIRPVETPKDILHFKTDCGLLDSGAIFATKRLADTGCFDDYRVITAPAGEEAAANLIRVNDHVLISAGFPQSEALLKQEGYTVTPLPTSQAALIDGGLSCMSLRCNGNGNGNGALHP